MVQLNPFRTALGLFDHAAEQLGLDAEAHELLRWPMREVRVSVPVRMNDGRFRVFQAHRVQYNQALGPTIGGFRWHTDSDLDAARATASWTTWQAGVMGLPHGGAMGGVDCNPKELSTGEKERLARGAARAFAGAGRADDDVYMPDTYTTPQIMGWMADTFARAEHNAQGTSTVAKPAILGGSPGLADATGLAGVVAVREAARALDLDPGALRFAVHGLGAIGRSAARRHMGLLGGGTLVAVSDLHGSAAAPDGLDAEEACAHKLTTGSVEGIEGSVHAGPEAIFPQETDVLYTAATAGLIDRDVAASMNTKIICELCDNPTTPEADQLFQERGIVVIPDMLGSGGRMTVAHCEVVQMRTGDRWSQATIDARIVERMIDAYAAVQQMATDEGVSMRLAAWMLGISRVAEACRARGWC